MTNKRQRTIPRLMCRCSTIPFILFKDIEPVHFRNFVKEQPAHLLWGGDTCQSREGYAGIRPRANMLLFQPVVKP